MGVLWIVIIVLLVLLLLGGSVTAAITNRGDDRPVVVMGRLTSWYLRCLGGNVFRLVSR